MARAVIDAARQRGRAVIVDPAPNADYTKYAGATLLTPNRAEFSRATGRTYDSIDAIAAAAKTCVGEWKLDALLVTLDRDGAIIVTPGVDPVHVPTRPRTIYDNTGAGDAVLAMLVLVAVVGCEPDSPVGPGGGDMIALSIEDSGDGEWAPLVGRLQALNGALTTMQLDDRVAFDPAKSLAISLESVVVAVSHVDVLATETGLDDMEALLDAPARPGRHRCGAGG